MDTGLMETLKSINDATRIAYQTGWDAGYAKGFAEGKIAGLDRSQEILHEVITGDQKDDRKID